MAPAVCGLVACIQDLSLKDRWPVFKTVDLVESAASVSVRGFVAHLSIDLTYENGFNQPVEVTYTCPVDARSAIYHFEAQLDGRTITGQCLERNKAEKIYKDAVEQGHTAIIAAEDKCSSDVLHLSLGNLGKGERAKLQMKMVQELSVGIDGSVTFTLPTVFNPRYSPADFVEFGNQPVHSFGGSVVQTQNQLYTMKVDAEVVGSNKIDKISSQSDQINFSLGDDDTTAKISHMGDFKCDHDFGFQIHYRSPYNPHVLRESGDRSSTGMMTDDIIMVNFFPEFPVEAYSPHNEIIFLVDRSGSMQGERIQSSKSALLLFLKSLPQGCRFNIISFGSTYSALFPSGSERYTESTLKTALDLQKSMDADMGGTEIFQALKFIYSKAPVPGYARKILVLTDGEVWNVNEIMELVERQSDEAQVFSVGIGDGASTALIHGLARAGRGRYEMVMDTNILQMKVMGLVASMLQDNVSDLSIKFEVDPPQKVTLIPNLPPIIFGGQHLIIYGRVAPNSELKSIVLSGKLKESTLTVAVEDKDCKTVHDGRLSIHRIAAKSQISSWQVNCTEGIQDEMIAMSLASGVVCRKTAIVGVDREGKVFKEKGPVSPSISSVFGSYSCQRGLFHRNPQTFGSFSAGCSVPPVASIVTPTPFGVGSGVTSCNFASQGLFQGNTQPLGSLFGSPVPSTASVGMSPRGYGFRSKERNNLSTGNPPPLGGLFGSSLLTPPPGSICHKPQQGLSFGSRVGLSLPTAPQGSICHKPQVQPINGSLFGSSLPKPPPGSVCPNPQQEHSFGSLFGSSLPTPPPGSICHKPQQGQPIGSSLFDSSVPPTPSGSICHKPQQEHSFGSLFGSSLPTPPPGSVCPNSQQEHSFGSLFGSLLSTPPPDSICHKPQQGQPIGSSLFGSSVPPTPSGSICHKPQQFGGSLFGSSVPPTPSAGIFHQTQQRQVFGESMFTNKSQAIGKFGLVVSSDAKESDDELLEIVSFQNFDGSWSLESCWNVLKIPEDKKHCFQSIQTEFNLDDVSFATVLCLTLLNVRFPTRKQEWNLISIKGNSFLQSKGHNDGSKIIDKFTEVIKVAVQCSWVD